MEGFSWKKAWGRFDKTLNALEKTGNHPGWPEGQDRVFFNALADLGVKLHGSQRYSINCGFGKWHDESGGDWPEQKKWLESAVERFAPNLRKTPKPIKRKPSATEQLVQAAHEWYSADKKNRRKSEAALRAVIEAHISKEQV